jgi:hypothetical protein
MWWSWIGWWLEMGQICIELPKLFWWLDLLGFFMAGLGALCILGSLAFTRTVKSPDIFESDDQVDQYAFKMTVKNPWGRKVVWWLICKGNLWFLFVSSTGFLMQIPAKIWH